MTSIYFKILAYILLGLAIASLFIKSVIFSIAILIACILLVIKAKKELERLR